MLSEKTGWLIVDGCLTGLISKKVTIKMIRWSDGNRVALFVHSKGAAAEVSHWLNRQKITYMVNMNFSQKDVQHEVAFDLYNLWLPPVDARELFDSLAEKLHEEYPRSRFWEALD